MGMFDDLIPQKASSTPAPSGDTGLFDDLIPDKPAAPARPKMSAEQLRQHVERSIKAAREHEGEAGVGQFAMESAAGAGQAVLNLPEAVKHGMLADIINVASGHKERVPQGKYSGMLAELKTAAKDLPGVRDALAGSWSADPEGFSQHMVEGLESDPELAVVPMAAGGRAGAGLLKAARQASKAAKAAEAAGDAAAAAAHTKTAAELTKAGVSASRKAGAAAGAGLAAGESVAEQKYVHGQDVTLGETALQAGLGYLGGQAMGEAGAKVGASALGRKLADEAAKPKLTALGTADKEAELARLQAQKNAQTLAQDPRQHPTYISDDVDRAITDYLRAPKGAAKAEAKKALDTLRKPPAKLSPEQALATVRKLQAEHPGLSDDEAAHVIDRQEQQAAQAHKEMMGKVDARQAYLTERARLAKAAGRASRASEIAEQVRQQREAEAQANAPRPGLPAPRLVDVGGVLVPETEAEAARTAAERRALMEKYKDQPSDVKREAERGLHAALPAPRIIDIGGGKLAYEGRSAEEAAFQEKYRDQPADKPKPLAGEAEQTVPESVAPDADYSWVSEYGPGEARNKGAERVPEQDIPRLPEYEDVSRAQAEARAIRDKAVRSGKEGATVGESVEQGAPEADWLSAYDPGDVTRNKGAERVAEQDLPQGAVDTDAMQRDLKAYAKATRQEGKMDPVLARKLGLTAAGAALGGIYLDKDDARKGAVAGAILGLGLATPSVLRAAATTTAAAYTTIMAPVDAAIKRAVQVQSVLERGAAAAGNKMGRTPYKAAKAAAATGALSWFMDWQPVGTKQQDPATRRAISAVATAALAGTLRYMLGQGLNARAANFLHAPGLEGVGLDVPRKTFTHVDDLLLEHAANTNIEDVNTAVRLNAYNKLAAGHVIDGTVLKALEKSPEEVAKLPANTQEVVRLQKEYYAKTGAEAKRLGVIKGMLDNYAPHIFDMSDRHTREVIEAWGVTKSGVGRASSTRTRQLPGTIQELMDSKLGLKFKTLNANDVMLSYHRAMISAIEDKRLIDGLERAGGLAEKPYVMPLGKDMPEGYVAMRDVKGLEGHPYMEGKAIDSQLVPFVRMRLKAVRPGAAAAAYDNVTGTVKAIGVSASMFHARSLFESAVQAGINPATAARNMPEYMKMIAEGQSQNWQRAGLKLAAGAPEGFRASGLGQKVYETMQRAGIGPVAALGKGYRKLSDMQEHMTFGVMQNGLKLQTAETIKGELLERVAQSGAEVTPGVEQAIEKQAAAYTNTLYGGINWTQEALDAESEMGFRAASWMASPQGQRFMARAVFAPDWLYASLNIAARATGVKPTAPELRALYQQAFYRNLLMTYAAKKALEHAFGSSDDDAKHPAFNHVQMGDGRYLQIFKHGGEAQHAVEDPMRFIINKASPLPSMAVAAVGDVKEHKEAFRITQDLLEKNLPFWTTAAIEGGQPDVPVTTKQFVEQSALSIIGAQTYGKKKKDQ